MSLPVLLTSRLRLRALDACDAPALQVHFARWEIVRYLPRRIPWPYPADEATRHLHEKVLPQMAKGTRHSWAMTLHGQPDLGLIGMIELDFATPYDQRAFWLALEWQGLGLMSEAVAAINDYALTGLGMPDLLFTSADANTPSNRLKDQSGAIPVQHGLYDFHAGRLPITRWRLSQQDWAKARPGWMARQRRWQAEDFQAKSKS